MTALDDDSDGNEYSEIVEVTCLDQSQVEGTMMSKPSEWGLNLPNGLTPMFSECICVNYMVDALQACVKIDCIMEPWSIQKRFYQVRRRCQARGDNRFDELEFRHENFWLEITRRGITATHQRRAELFALGSVRRFIYLAEVDFDSLMTEVNETPNDLSNPDRRTTHW